MPHFGALQRAEIAEIDLRHNSRARVARNFGALQRAEIAEIAFTAAATSSRSRDFGALQRAEIAEIRRRGEITPCPKRILVLFNEPKLLKSPDVSC